MYCSLTAVSKVDSVCKQGKSYDFQVDVEVCKYTDAESQQCNMLGDSVDDGGYFEA